MKSDVQKIFAKRLARAREMRTYSQADVAKFCGLQPSAMSHFECGRRAPSMENIRKLALALDVTVDFLLGLHDSPCGTIVYPFDKLKAKQMDMVKAFAATLRRMDK